ncbi:MAG TPA: hypothetical protein VLG69_02805 [Candidatus Andersenbacteria bacterium]|nr:hypothetical protein [Candidatus Andersenbacteria bacterium]
MRSKASRFLLSWYPMGISVAFILLAYIFYSWISTVLVAGSSAQIVSIVIQINWTVFIITLILLAVTSLYQLKKHSELKGLLGLILAVVISAKVIFFGYFFLLFSPILFNSSVGGPIHVTTNVLAYIPSKDRYSIPHGSDGLSDIVVSPDKWSAAYVDDSEAIDHSFDGLMIDGKPDIMYKKRVVVIGPQGISFVNNYNSISQITATLPEFTRDSHQIQEPIISLDGKYIAHRETSDGEANQSIEIMDNVGTTIANGLVYEWVSEPSFLDNRTVAFVAFDGSRLVRVQYKILQ